MQPDRWACGVLFLFQPSSFFQLTYKKDLSKMGSSHYSTLNTEDNLSMKNSRKVNKMCSEVSQ